MAERKENRGGKRPNSGRKPGKAPKPLPISQDALKLYRAAKKLEKETGQSVADFLVSLIKSNQLSVSLQAVKLYYEVTQRAASLEKPAEAPKVKNAFNLPPRKADPAKEILKPKDEVNNGSQRYQA